MTNSKEEKSVSKNNPEQYESVLDIFNDIPEDLIETKENCKLCTCEHRAEAEAYWEKTKYNASAVVRLLEGKGFSVTDKAVSNHMKYHYSSQKRKIATKQYVGQLQEFLKVKVNRIQEINMLRAVLIKELLDIGAEGDALSLPERRKNAEILSKISSQILSCNESERKMTEDFRPVHIFVEKLTDIIEIEIQNATPETKTKLTNVVNALYREVEGISLETK